MLMMKKMRTQNLFLFALLFSFFLCEAADVSDECATDFQKLTACLSYATGKATTPSKDCCTGVKDIKESDPKCLCYIIQMTHNGSNTAKSMGIQEAKLLQLPSACQLQNASVSNCPKLLGIPAGSPEAAIFTNVSSSATPATTTGTSSTPSAAEKTDASNGTKNGPYLVGPTVAIAMAIIFFGFPAGFNSMLYILG